MNKRKTEEQEEEELPKKQEKKNANERTTLCRTKDKQKIIDENRRESMEQHKDETKPQAAAATAVSAAPFLSHYFPFFFLFISCHALLGSYKQFIVDPSSRLCSIYIVPSHFIVCLRSQCVLCVCVCRGE